jgi:outer membrane protein assembly factor BamE
MALDLRLLFFLLTLTLSSSLIGCNLGYHIAIDQGNIVTPEQISQLQLGMRRDKVRFIMGTPLVKHPFHVDRWDYVYSSSHNYGKSSIQDALSLFFVDEFLTTIQHNTNETLK